MKPSPNNPGRPAASEISATLQDVMDVQAAVPLRLRAFHDLRALEPRPDHPLLPRVAGPAQIEAAVPAAPPLAMAAPMRGGART